MKIALIMISIILNTKLAESLKSIRPNSRLLRTLKRSSKTNTIPKFDIPDILSSKLKSTKSIEDLISFKNTQKAFPIDEHSVRDTVHKIQKLLKVEDFHVDIWFCTDGKMRELNSDWRGKTKSTDILSFPVNEFTSPEVFQDTYAEGVDKHLGDIVVSPGYVHRQMIRDKMDYENGNILSEEEYEDAGVSKAMATEFDLNKRISLLFIHGILHLLGYDHMTTKDWERMTKREDEIIQAYTNMLQ